MQFWAYSLNIMMSEPDIFDNCIKLQTDHKPKRRFKIFAPQLQPPPQTNNSLSILSAQPSHNTHTHSVKQTVVNKPAEMVKIEAKSVLQREFYGEPEDDDEIVLLDVKMDQYETVRSNKFGESDQMRQMTTTAPSVMFKNNQFIINQESPLYQSIKTVKDGHFDLQNEFAALTASVRFIDSSVQAFQSEAQQNMEKLRGMEVLLESMYAERSGFDKKINEIDHRIERIEKSITGETANTEKVEEIEEIKVLEEEDGLRKSMSEEEDEFAESHYLPVEFITKYLEQRNSQKDAQLKIEKQQKEECSIRNERMKVFHPIFKIKEYEYNCLLQFLLEELPSQNENNIIFRLVFRRGTTDLQAESTGEKADLEYKEKLLFLVKTSTGKRIGGFISNYLIEEESMEDPHAFLFTFEEHCHKFKIKEECANEAFSASKYYLITFSSDLMISSNCLEEENYCEWPSSYAGSNQRDNTWLAGDFQFMIEHIEVFEVVQASE